ncbi:MAG: C4-dicarboxylate ABC transporter substrate-binding protein [Desulfobacula sp. RIFOXYA12_FULL_46_16]|nr:MAG: C4-dicarboxylate ABC transporter substrate-binding protein [Deltaproteobacteria bacterium RIFOXYC2_FULL_48_10]OGR20606.1 MAG: C4-dicarboxylate ABC transporter substrate-binding protein [Desulfobacula sp. RIFOXYA12_FULL_46_16]
MKFLDHLEEWLVATLIGAATVIIFLSVVHRYASGLPIPGLQDWLLSINMSWSQELCIYMFIWMAKFGAAYGVRTGIHVGVDVFINSLKDKTRAKFVVIGLSGGALFTGIIGTIGFGFVWEVGLRYAVATTFGFNWPDLTSGPVSPDLEWPVWIFYSAIPLGSYLMCFRFLQVIKKFIQTGQLPQTDTSHVDGLSEDFDFGEAQTGPAAGTKGGNS